ncbi:MAG: helix-turn-helix domain-containing protein [Nocardioidaceae bacterium]|nr:helix-turn-helix domain-containing protein [Nocardioidaceae bacterium]
MNAPRTRWLSQAEAAEHMGVSTRTLRTWVSQGRIAAYRAPGGRLVRFKEADLDACMRRVPTVGGAR